MKPLEPPVDELVEPLLELLDHPEELDEELLELPPVEPLELLAPLLPPVRCSAMPPQAGTVTAAAITI
jgi:hypothetical protein